jgi:WS/DGAT/MGAT family acyltransferase
MESRNTPLHVGALFTFTLPEGAKDNFLGDLAADLRRQRGFTHPWNLKLRGGFRGKVVPTWVEDDDVDLDYHFRHSALPRPGGERELGILASRLHSQPLDFRRPLWEIHLIEGLEHNRFAIYLKIHHSVVDGVSGMRMMMKAMSEDPTAPFTRAPWTFGPGGSTTPGGAQAAKKPGSMLGAACGVFQGLAKAATDDGLIAPWESPRSVLSEPMTAKRRFATQRVSLDLVKSAARATDCTVNDMVLWLCSTALRRFMKDTGELPNKPLNAAVPVNLREGDEDYVGTNIGLILTGLATTVDDPVGRLEEIKRSSSAAKIHLRAMPPESRLPFTAVTGAGMALTQLTRLDNVLPPLFSVGISNVPGPANASYLAGARLEAVYPMSFLLRQGALNITCITVDGTINFGVIGAQDTLPHLQHLAVYLGDAAEEMEKLFVAR